MARGGRKATDAVADTSDRNKQPSRRAATKVKSAVQRAGDKIEQAGRSMQRAGHGAKRRAKTRTRSHKA